MKEEVLKLENTKQKFGKTCLFGRQIKIKFSFKILNKLIFSFIIISVLYYITGINDLTVKGFRLQELKTEVSKLQEENRNVKLKVMALESYSNLSERAKELNMVAMGEDVEYITVTAGASVVAKK